MNFGAILSLCMHLLCTNLLFGCSIKRVKVLKSSLEGPPTSSTLLINMYAKCKQPLHACLVFDDLGERNVFAWNALLWGLAQNGLWETSLFILMKNEGCEIGL